MSDKYSNRVAAEDVRLELGSKTLPRLPWHVYYHALLWSCGRRLVHGWWAWELIAASVSGVAMVSLITLLAKMDQRQQQDWMVGNTQLTLNTIVVAIGTLIRSSLLLAVAGALNQCTWNWFAAQTGSMDTKGQPLKDLETFGEAASNSWNCLKLLWRTKGRYTASIGALIMVLSLVFDIFVQQVLTTTIQARVVKLSGPNLTAENIIPRALSYGQDDIGHADNLDEEVQVQSVIRSSITQTLSGAPGGVCTTGNCTWPITPTLGVCSQCMGVGSTVTTTSNSTCNSTIYTLFATSGYFYSGDREQISNKSVSMDTCVDANYAAWTLDFVQYPFAGDEDVPIKRRSSIADLYSFGKSFQESPPYSVGNQAPFTAHRCNLYFCVRGFSASLSSGKMIHQQTKATADQSYQARYPNTSLSDYYSLDDLPQELNIVPTDVFNYTIFAVIDLGTWLSEAISGGVESIVLNHDFRYAEMYPSSAITKLFWEASGSLANITALAQSIADGLTTHIRTSSPAPAPDARYAPDVGISVLVTSVRWAWLAYPLILQMGGLVFLGITMWSTHRRRVRPWKGHRVPLLLANIDDKVRTRAQGGLAHRTGLDDRVGALRVRLEFDGDDGIAFRRV